MPKKTAQKMMESYLKIHLRPTLCHLTASNNSNEKQTLAQATWSATASDGTSVTVSGSLPQGGKVSAALASASIAGEKTVFGV